MISHLYHPPLRSRWGEKRCGSNCKVISGVVPRLSTEQADCGSLARFRLKWEGTDPASRGLAKGLQGHQRVGVSS